MRIGKGIGKGFLPLLGLLSLVPAFGQDVPTPEIRRAIPVPPRENATPVSAAIPVMRAIPVSTQPTASPTPPPAPVTAPSPQRVAAPISNRTTGDDSGSIRLGPSATSDPGSAAKAQLAVADGFYSRKDPASAVTEYEKFLIMVPKDHPDRAKALYRLGESQRQMGSSSAAEATYASLLASSATGTYHPGAAYRLGELRQAAGDPSAAATNFAVAAEWTADPSIRQAAIYRQAECLEKMGRQREADALYNSLLATEATTTGTAGAPRSLAQPIPISSQPSCIWHPTPRLRETGRPRSPTTAGSSPLRPRAMPGQKQRSDRRRSSPNLENRRRPADSSPRWPTRRMPVPWHGVATLALLRLAGASGDDDAVLKLSQEAVTSDGENRPEIMLLRADALRRKGRHAEALELYDAIMRENPAARPPPRPRSSAFSLSTPPTPRRLPPRSTSTC